MTLIEFLLARIAEDEAEYTSQLSDYPTSGEERSIRFHLAECAAKRKIIEAYVDERQRRDTYQSSDGRAAEVDESVDPLIRERQVQRRRAAAAECRGLERAVEALATVYADHPDYREEWR